MDHITMTKAVRLEELGGDVKLLPRVGVTGSRLMVFSQAEAPVLTEISLVDGSIQRRLLEDPGVEIHFVQALAPNRRLLVSAFSEGGEKNAFVYDGSGKRLFSFRAGDAVEEVQVMDDTIWIGYMEDGILKEDSFSKHGALALDPEGNILFSYRETAGRQGLPGVRDCYGLNATEDGEVWLYYSIDHLMARITRGRVKQFWKGGPVLSWHSPLVQARGFALWNRQLLFATPARELYWASLRHGILERVKPVDVEGREIAFSRYWTRDFRLFLLEGSDVYLYDMKQHGMKM
ncbi:hypothetical protein [Paludifilum halophilum]|nr:hypothetical protein [Paludifilum halophilum]